MALIFLILLSIYASFIILCIIKFVVYRDKQSNSNKNPYFSILVSVKNEQDNIEKFLDCILSQNYKNFEILIADDHSSDNTYNILARYQEHYSFLKVFQFDCFGKKNVIKQLRQNAKYQYIVQTDGDCFMHNMWLEEIKNCVKANDPDLIIAPLIQVKNNNSILENLIQTESLAILSITSGTALLSNATMCNGANMIYKNHLEISNKKSKNHLGGDDIFLLHDAKRNKRKIVFLKNNASTVYTFAATSLKEMFSQRARWAQKTSSYNDAFTILLALLVFFANFSMFFLWLLPCYLAITGLCIKFFVDMLSVVALSKYYHIKSNIFCIILLEIIYPSYILITIIKALIKGGKKW